MGRRWVCFWMDFFCIFLNIFSLPPTPATTCEGVGVCMDGGGGYVFGFILICTLGSEWLGPRGGLATYTHTYYRLD